MIMKFLLRLRSLANFPNQDSPYQNRVDQVIPTGHLTNQVSNPRNMSNLRLRNSIHCHLSQLKLIIHIKYEYN